MLVIDLLLVPRLGHGLLLDGLPALLAPAGSGVRALVTDGSMHRLIPLEHGRGVIRIGACHCASWHLAALHEVANHGLLVQQTAALRVVRRCLDRIVSLLRAAKHGSTLPINSSFLSTLPAARTHVSIVSRIALLASLSGGAAPVATRVVSTSFAWPCGPPSVRGRLFHIF